MQIIASLISPGIMLCCLISALFAYIWYKRRMRLLSMTTETSGIITKLIEPKTNPRDPAAEPVYRMWVGYTVDGKSYKTYMHRKASAASYQEGQELTVIYDPDKPSRAVPKDFEGAKDYWISFPIIMLCISAAFLLISINTLPDVLNMSEHNETVFKIVFNLCLSAVTIAGMTVYIRGGFYRKEKETSPKGAKATLALFIVILGETLFDAVWDIIFL